MYAHKVDEARASATFVSKSFKPLGIYVVAHAYILYIHTIHKCINIL